MLLQIFIAPEKPSVDDQSLQNPICIKSWNFKIIGSLKK